MVSGTHVNMLNDTSVCFDEIKIDVLEKQRTLCFIFEGH